MHNISAYDSAFGYPGRNGKSTAFKTPPGRYRTDGYATDWLNQATVVPFLRSLAPSKLLVDTEVHTFSAMKCAFVQRTMHGFSMASPRPPLLLCELCWSVRRPSSHT